MKTLNYLKRKIMFHNESFHEEHKENIKPPRPPPPRRKQSIPYSVESDEHMDLIDLLRFEDVNPDSSPPSTSNTSSMDFSYATFFDSNSTAQASFFNSNMFDNTPRSSYSCTTPHLNNSTLDPFAEFMNSTARSSPNSGGNSAVNTPKQSRPNYSRAAFDSLNSSSTSAKPKITTDAFGDLLSGHGFTAASTTGTPKSMADMQRAEEIKSMDPVQIKMRDWTKGKEKNIRALLGSLNDVLWEGADKWQQPSMAELLQASQIKKWYRKACLVVHPDKQTGTPHEELARAIFTQLNIAWVTHNKH